MKRFLPIAGLLITILALIYLESPYSFINKEHVQVTIIPNEVLLAKDQEAENTASQDQEAEEASGNGNEEIAAQNYSLEMVLEGKSEKEGYIVETYREYEFYRNEDGQVIKKVPTSNYNYLRYYDK